MAVVVIYSSLLFIYFKHFNSSNFSNEQSVWGTFGDFFGGTLSPIIGIFSIYLTYKIISKQNEDSEQNEFKNMFQILFDTLPKAKESIVINRLEGQKAILKLNSELKKTYSRSYVINGQNSSNFQLNIEKAFYIIREDSKNSFDPFMKNLYNVLKFIDSYCLDARKEDYVDLLRVQFNTHELVFIFYNAIGSRDHSNFKNLLIKFNFLKEVIFSDEINEELLILYNIDLQKKPLIFRIFNYEMAITKFK